MSSKSMDEKDWTEPEVREDEESQYFLIPERVFDQ